MQKNLKHFSWLALVCFALTACQSIPSNSKPEVISVKKIWDAGQHNAFTDLIRFQDKWFCTFRESDAHVGGEGKIRVLVSDDGEQWKSAALLAESGVDLRDPKFSITPDRQLMLVMGGSIYEEKNCSANSRVSPSPRKASTGPIRKRFWAMAIGSGA